MYGWFVNVFPLSRHSISALQKSMEKAPHPFQVLWKPILSRYYGNRLKNKADFDNSRLTIAISKILSKIIAAFVKPIICQLRVFICRNKFLWELLSFCESLTVLFKQYQIVSPLIIWLNYLQRFSPSWKAFKYYKRMKVWLWYILTHFFVRLLTTIIHYNHKQNIFRIY